MRVNVTTSEQVEEVKHSEEEAKCEYYTSAMQFKVNMIHFLNYEKAALLNVCTRGMLTRDCLQTMDLQHMSTRSR